jgi:hypothetical protein
MWKRKKTFLFFGGFSGLFLGEVNNRENVSDKECPHNPRKSQ